MYMGIIFSNVLMFISYIIYYKLLMKRRKIEINVSPKRRCNERIDSILKSIKVNLSKY